MSKVIKLDGMTVRAYCEQRKWDHWDDDEEQQAMGTTRAAHREGAALAYQDIINFLDDSYRPEYLESVADRAERRRLYGPHRND